MKLFLTLLALLLLAPPAVIQAADLPAQQLLKDFRRVVVADDANSVQRAAAESASRPS